ncbi:MAG TPA: hypothetical protein VGI45_28105 [Terracidiphilus sp.]
MSGFLIDTNAISELIKTTPASKVAAWIDATDEQLFHLSVITLPMVTTDCRRNLLSRASRAPASAFSASSTGESFATGCPWLVTT